MSQHCGFTPKKPEILCFFKIGSQIQWLNIMNSHIIICSPYFLMKISCLGQFGSISHFWTTPIRFFSPQDTHFVAGSQLRLRCHFVTRPSSTTSSSPSSGTSTWTAMVIWRHVCSPHMGGFFKCGIPKSPGFQ